MPIEVPNNLKAVPAAARKIVKPDIDRELAGQVREEVCRMHPSIRQSNSAFLTYALMDWLNNRKRQALGLSEGAYTADGVATIPLDAMKGLHRLATMLGLTDDEIEDENLVTLLLVLSRLSDSYISLVIKQFQIPAEDIREAFLGSRLRGLNRMLDVSNADTGVNDKPKFFTPGADYHRD